MLPDGAPFECLRALIGGFRSARLYCPVNGSDEAWLGRAMGMRLVKLG